MKLYIRQKVFSWADTFTVKDEYGQDRYFVKGEVFSWGKKLHVYDACNREVLFIRQKVWSFLPKYHVFIGERQIAEIVKEFTFFRQSYSISGLNWSVDGSYWQHDYSISSGSGLIADIHKQWMTWGDCYELNITNPSDEIVALAVVLAIDCAMATKS